MGNVIYTGNTEMQKNQNQTFSTTILFDSGIIKFDQNNYKWKVDGKEITSNYDKFQPYSFTDYYTKSSGATSNKWYSSFYNGFKIPLTLDTLKSYSEITVTIQYVPHKTKGCLILSNMPNGESDKSQFCMEVVSHSGSFSVDYYSVSTLTNLGSNLYLSKNQLASTDAGKKFREVSSIYDVLVENMGGAKYDAWLLDLSNSTNGELYIKAFYGGSSSDKNLQRKELKTIPIGDYFEELRIIISGK